MKVQKFPMEGEVLERRPSCKETENLDRGRHAENLHVEDASFCSRSLANPPILTIPVLARRPAAGQRWERHVVLAAFVNPKIVHLLRG